MIPSPQSIGRLGSEVGMSFIPLRRAPMEVRKEVEEGGFLSFRASGDWAAKLE